jgi:hypothetical protein
LADDGPDEEPQYDRWSRPQALSRRGYVLAVLVPLLVAAAAFGVVSLVSAGDDTRSGTTVRLPVSGWGVGSEEGDAAALEGVLRVDDDQCVYVEAGQDGDQSGRVVPVWPIGFHAALDHNRLAVYDQDDHEVAQDGDRISVSGGSLPAGTFASEPCVPDSGDVFAVQSDVTVLE